MYVKSKEKNKYLTERAIETRQVWPSSEIAPYYFKLIFLIGRYMITIDTTVAPDGPHSRMRVVHSLTRSAVAIRLG